MPTDTKQTIKILLIEENEAIRLYFRDAFWLHGLTVNYEVSFACDVAQAEKVIRQPGQSFDFIFLDLALHALHRGRNVVNVQAGLKLVEEIRSLPQWESTQVVILASPGYYSFWKKAKKLGADFFLKNDMFLPHHLVKWVEQTLLKKARA